ncbi:hypothetical protein M885DRAFT_456917 [Pelagophyceae sp. CCMP2097]|nr:hypothetical protein M885DRAFT_456917 [Pelagophyceae sp. CCMP2097]
MGNFQDRLQEAGHAPARAHEQLRLVICSDLVQEYEDASVATIRECYETMVQVYGRCWCCFTQEQFEAVFSLAFADPEAHFRLWRIASDDDDVFDVCNVFQVFCALFLLCDEPLQGLDGKIHAIFDLFDFDQSDALNKVEVVCLFQSCVEGLARATSTPAACSSSRVKVIAEDFFDSLPDPVAVAPVLDEGGLPLPAVFPEKDCSFSQLQKWASASADVDDYLSYFAHAHFVLRYQQRVEEAFGRATRDFAAAANDGQVGISQLKDILRAVPGSPATEDEMDHFAKLLDEAEGRELGLGEAAATDGLVGFDAFARAVMPWIVFSAVDEDHSATLSPGEMKLLIWVSEGDQSVEPTAAVVAMAAQAMDVDGDGLITRLEWIAYTSNYDAATGLCRFSHASKKLFKDLDTTGTERVPCKAIKDLFTKDLQQVLVDVEHAAGGARFHPKSLEQMRHIIREAVVEISELLDADGDGFISWDEFSSNFQRTITVYQTKICQYAKVLLRKDYDEQQHLVPTPVAATSAPGKHVRRRDRRKHTALADALGTTSAPALGAAAAPVVAAAVAAAVATVI